MERQYDSSTEEDGRLYATYYEPDTKRTRMLEGTSEEWEITATLSGRWIVSFVGPDLTLTRVESILDN